MSKLRAYYQKVKILGWKPVVGNSLYNRINFILMELFRILFIFIPLKNIISIESHNDFDCNGGAFYRYLIEYEYNKKYKIIWFVKNNNQVALPYNVFTVPMKKISLKKYYYLSVSKFLLSEETFLESYRKGQVSVYCTHGGCTFKNVKGLINVPSRINYILSSSLNYDPFICKNYSIPYPNNRMLHIGYPSNDTFYNTVESEYNLFMKKRFKKYILWMPTFRKGGGDLRNDSSHELPYGIPLFETDEQIRNLNLLLSQYDILLTIKIHPMQNPDTIRKLKNNSNIIVLDGKIVKKYNIDNYRLMFSSDALLSDYSSVSYSFLMLNRPIGFVISDINEYKIGFLVDNIYHYMPGEKIYNFKDFVHFVDDLVNGFDTYKAERTELLDWLYEYKDGNSSQRLAQFLKI